MLEGVDALPGAALGALLQAARDVVSDLDLERVAHAAADAARTLTGGSFGVLVHEGRHAVSGIRPAGFDVTAPPWAAALAPALRGAGTVRHDDVSSLPGLGSGADHLRSCLAAPVSSRTGEQLGALVVGHTTADRFDERHELLLQAISGYAAIALANAREHRAQREIAGELQQAMLPEIGFHEGVELAVRYRPAARRAQVGGDWYDVLRLDDGRLALTVGDVAGHNVSAAARMGVVRNALNVHVLREVDPGRSLLALEQHLLATGQKGFVTVVQAVLDPADASLVVARAGHPPPLVVPASGRPRFLDGDPSPPVGVGLLRRPPEVVRVDLQLGDTVVLYTDGLIEQRRTATDVRMTRLRELVAGLPERTAERLCDEILARFVDHPGGEDDVAMLAVRPLAHVPTRRTSAGASR